MTRPETQTKPPPEAKEDAITMVRLNEIRKVILRMKVYIYMADIPRTAGFPHKFDYRKVVYSRHTQGILRRL